MTVTGVHTAHGPLTLNLGPVSKTISPGPLERIGWSAIGFKIEFDGLAILGDTKLFRTEWDLLQHCDVLMLPIGGSTAHNTMDEMEAIEAIKRIQPRLAIPCHYNCPAFFTKRYNPADAQMFKNEATKLGIDCRLLAPGEMITIGYGGQA